jgi:hypothetical protein
MRIKEKERRGENSKSVLDGKNIIYHHDFAKMTLK